MCLPTSSYAAFFLSPSHANLMSTPTSSPDTHWKRGFWFLMGTQTQNAFSDNTLKTLVTFLVIAKVPESHRDSYVAGIAALFAAPFILFSMLGGWLADRFSKKRVMEMVKLVEVAIMVIAALALYLQSMPLEFLAVFLMGCHSSAFGPAKYGILPEILPLKLLSWGNGVVEMLTFVGVIAGTVAAGYFASVASADTSIAALPGLILAALAVAGWFMARGITPVKAADPTAPLRINPVTDLWKQLKVMRPDRDLWRANWGFTGFFFVAALVQMNLLLYAKNVLHLDETHNGYLNAALAIGIGVGSYVAGLMSHGKIEYRLVPLGAAGLALASVPMGVHGISTAGFSIFLCMMGFSAGLFIVPVAAVLQHRPAPEHKGAVQGASGLLSWVGILAASGVQELLSLCRLGPGHAFWFCGLLALATGIYVLFTRSWVESKEPAVPV